MRGGGGIQRGSPSFGSLFLPVISARPVLSSAVFLIPLFRLPSMPLHSRRSRQPAPMVRRFGLVSLLLSALLAPPVLAQDNDMFPTKAAALQRAKELKCTGAFAMGKDWMPCKDFATYEKAVRKES